MKKVYYQLKLYQKSPLRISSGDNETTDSDLMLDGRGCPFIPGSSVAGVLRDLCMNAVRSLSEAEVDQLFGYISGETLAESHVLVSDAVGPATASAADYKITIRDGIRLDEWGITVRGNKYDFQVAETELPYYSVLEWTGSDEEYQKENPERSGSADEKHRLRRDCVWRKNDQRIWKDVGICKKDGICIPC